MFFLKNLSLVLPSMVSFDLMSLVQETNDGYLFTAMVSILLSSFKIAQLTNVYNYELQGFLSLSVYFSFFNFKMINSGLIMP